VARSKKPSPCGVLVIDKPPGVTSHDVVKRVRHALHTRRVGHAGTLDPMATGVLVVMVGEATKLAPFLTADDKSYEAMVQLGRATDTLDAEGATTAEGELPSWWHDDEAAAVRLEAALEQERSRELQLPPVFSAIKVAGRSAHARVRAGEQVELEPRAVRVRTLQLLGRSAAQGSVRLRLAVGKGYYVRALARDLGEALETPAHLCELRRTASGAFELSDACSVDATLDQQLWTLEAATARAMPKVTRHHARRGLRHAAAPGASRLVRPKWARGRSRRRAQRQAGSAARLRPGGAHRRLIDRRTVALSRTDGTIKLEVERRSVTNSRPAPGGRRCDTVGGVVRMCGHGLDITEPRALGGLGARSQTALPLVARAGHQAA